MPYICLVTNKEVPDASTVLKKLSALSARETAKPEEYIMVALKDRQDLFFAGSPDPAAYIECKSIGLPESLAKDLSAAFCGFCENELGIPGDRVYIEFADAKGPMWGYKGGTF